jgi:hypothetical protein
MKTRIQTDLMLKSLLALAVAAPKKEERAGTRRPPTDNPTKGATVPQIDAGE